MNKNKIAVSAVAFLVAMVAIYVLVPQGRNPTSIPSDLKEAMSMVDQANAHSLPTSGWEIYTPRGLALSFQHPTDLLFQDMQNGVNVYADTIENRAYLKDPSKYESSRPGMFIVAVGQEDAERFAERSFPNQQHVVTTLFGGNTIVLTGQGMDRWDMILFTHADMLYEVTIQYGSSDERRRYYSILSSFSFK